MSDQSKAQPRDLPSVGYLLQLPLVGKWRELHGRQQVVNCLREAVEYYRRRVLAGEQAGLIRPEEVNSSFKPIIATGISSFR